MTKRLRGYNLVYLATPYTRYRKGRDAAFAKANEIACHLIQRGVNVFSAVTYGHPLSYSEGGSLDPECSELWDRINDPFLDVSDALLVGLLDGWQESRGVHREVERFKQAGKPRFYLEPRTLVIVRSQTLEGVS